MSDDEPTNPGIGHVLRAIEAKDLKDAARHKLVFDEIQALWGSHRLLADRMTKVERSSFPTAPLWAIVALGSVTTAIEVLRWTR